MLSRFISKPSHFRILSRISSQAQSISDPYTCNHSPPKPNSTPLFNSSNRFFSSNRNNNDNKNGASTSGGWSFTQENDDQLFTEETGDLAGFTDSDAHEVKPVKKAVHEVWTKGGDEDVGDIFGVNETLKGDVGGGGGDWLSVAEVNEPWSLDNDEKASEDVFDIGEGIQELSDFDFEGESNDQVEKREEAEKLQREEKELMKVLKGPDRAFGDLIAASGITDAMLDSLIALKDFSTTPGLRPLADLENQRYENNTKKSTRAEIERQKQEEVAKARVRLVDDKGRAYGTGRRKCSIARVFLQPGEGKFVVNDKEFDVYFPMIDHRAALLRPFNETKTLGLWNIDCTVKGGGVSGQVGAIRLGISRALQNWEPGFRPALKQAGFLTRDPRVVERKKPGKAKARKSFQWVKR